MEVIKGNVIHGESIGKKQGYPTANLASEVLKDNNIAKGVYIADVFLESKKYHGILVIGVSGIKIQKNGKVEIYLLDYKGDLYSKEIIIKPIEKIRSLVTFKNNKDLLKRIKEDINIATNYFVSAK